MISEKERSLTSSYFYNRTCKVVPNGVQTLSKMPSKHVEGVYPYFLERGEGAYVYDELGNRYIDYPCGLGSVILGYAEPQVNRAIREQLDKSVIFSLPHKLETELAEKICQIIPSAEMVRFLKTGSEATSAAVKLARAYTGRRKIICCGYHGWHDWYNWTTPKNKGVPAQEVLQLTYNKPQEFDYCLQGGVRNKKEYAAVILEPYVLEPPKDDFLKKLREFCTRHGALLIFDEIITGFRTRGLSAQTSFGVTPDLTCLGKAMANGLPISCVCGKREVMEELGGDCFVSSTFGGELLSIVAALKTIDIIQQENVIKHIWKAGSAFKQNFNSFAKDLDIEAECIGLPPRTFFKFPTEYHKSLFWQECLKRGVLFGYAQFINNAHRGRVLEDTYTAMRESLEVVANHWQNPKMALEGKVAEETFRLAVQR